MIISRMNKKLSTLTSMALISALALAACADDDAETEAPDDAEAQEVEAEDDADDDRDHDHEDEDEDDEPSDPAEREAHEAGGPQPRAVVAYDGGVAVLDGVSLEVLGDFAAQGFLRLNPAGDGRHAFLTEGDSFRLLDTGTWGEPHGDHNHYYTTEPYLSDVTVDGDTPAHVVAHDGIGTLFFDGTGEYHWFDLADLDVESEIETESAETEGPHHGVAAVLQDGSRFETLEDRSGARFIDAEGEEVARSQECPGVHGEAAGPDGIIAVGCEDGVLIWHGDHFDKIDAGPEYARIGNLFAAEGSSVFLGDYREDEEEPMTEIALVDAESLEITTSDVSSPYNYRTLQRGPEGEAVVLTEDGRLHIIDAETGEHLDHLEVLDEWTEPEEWQEPSPTVRVIGDLAYITDPGNQQIHLVDLAEREIIAAGDLDFEPNEMVVLDGRPVEDVSDEYEGDHDHEHDDEDHDDEDHDHDHDDDEDHDH